MNSENYSMGENPSEEILDVYKTATFNLATINFVMYIITSFVGGSIILTGAPAVILFGLSESTLRIGWLWTPITSIFAHSSISHIGFNLIYLFIFGFKLEERGYSKEGVYLMYLVTGIASGILSMILFLPAASFSLGASGAVFGLLGANVGIEKKNHEESYRRVLFISIFLFIFASGPNTNVFAHLIGLIAGYLLGNSEYLEKYNTKLEAFK